ncbi:hypothetical protein J6590_075597 [Homalodisca vitripennis]|nr:hypothetical protein J6590_075597 [Homalodisca vitripennis]
MAIEITRAEDDRTGSEDRRASRAVPAARAISGYCGGQCQRTRMRYGYPVGTWHLPLPANLRHHFSSPPPTGNTYETYVDNSTFRHQ